MDYPEIPQLMEEIGTAVTHCRFEGTDPETDEVVLVKILKVLLKAMQIDAGCLLSDDVVYDMVQTAFKMSIQLHLSGMALTFIQLSLPYALYQNSLASQVCRNDSYGDGSNGFCVTSISQKIYNREISS